ncbi:MAG: signal peptidase I [Anaerolineae bacterium]|nr:signal peptidase I [Anaerolineae bacterium]
MSTFKNNPTDKDFDSNASSGSDDTTPTPKTPTSHSERPLPLPDFDENEQFEPNVKTSNADPTDLNHLLDRQRASTPAEGDFSDYSLSPLEDETPPEEEESRWQTAWSILREVGETIILTLIIFFLIQTVVRNFRVVGTSMVNNLHNGQYLIIDKVSYNPLLMEYLGIGGPQRGDVIVFKPPGNPNEDYVKRIIGLSGEEVNVVNGQVYINGEPLAEPFQPVPGTYTMPNPVIVPDGQIFVLGDNRNNSNDSHNWGPLPVENIVGRAWLSYWPPDQWGTIPRDIPTEDATLKHFVGQFIPSASANSE